MDQGPEKSKAPSASYRETFRRHRKLFCLPVILGALAAGFFIFGMGKTYKSTASLWVDTAPSVPSSVGAGSNGLSEPPAVAEQQILSELLATRSFATAVAQNSALGKSGADPLEALGAGQVQEAVPGGQVLQISYTAASPAVAESVLGAIITQLRSYGNRLNADHDKASVANDRAQVRIAEQSLATARRSLNAYQAQHPGISQTDPQYAYLAAAENNAATQLAQANAALNQSTGSGNSPGWSIRVVDQPSRASATKPGKSKMAEVVFAGVLGGVLVSFLAIVLLTPAKKEAWEDELPVRGPLGSDVPPADPFRPGSSVVPPAPAQSMPPAPTGGGQPRLSLGDRGFALDLRGTRGDVGLDHHGRFQFRTPAAHSDEQ